MEKKLIFDKNFFEIAVLNVYLPVVSIKSVRFIFVFWFRGGGTGPKYGGVFSVLLGNTSDHF